jgi:predicted HicB family RNase H-like nuclease
MSYVTTIRLSEKNHTLAKTFASANQIGLIEYIQYLIENKLPPIEDGFYYRSFYDGEKYSKQVRINKKLFSTLKTYAKHHKINSNKIVNTLVRKHTKPIISPKNGVFEIAEKQIKF